MEIILLKTILNLLLIFLRIIIIVFNIIKSIVDYIGSLILFLLVIITIFYIFKKNHEEIGLYIVAIIFVTLIQAGLDFVVISLVAIYEKVDRYKISKLKSCV